MKCELYDDVNNLYDIALIKLNEKVEFNRDIQPACLPDIYKKHYPDVSGMIGYVAGWVVILLFLKLNLLIYFIF